MSDFSLNTISYGILSALGSQQMHSYAIGKAAEKTIKQSIPIATLYNNIDRLLKQNLIEKCPRPADETDSRRRSYYKATGLGKRRLEEHINYMRSIYSLPAPQPIV